ASVRASLRKWSFRSAWSSSIWTADKGMKRASSGGCPSGSGRPIWSEGASRLGGLRQDGVEGQARAVTGDAQTGFRVGCGVVVIELNPQMPGDGGQLIVAKQGEAFAR